MLRTAINECVRGKKRLSRAVFDVSYTVVWRYLTARKEVRLCKQKIVLFQAVNSIVRTGAFAVQAAIFPPLCDDPIQQEEMMKRHYQCFIDGVCDDVVEICVAHIEALCNMLSIWFADIPTDWQERFFKELCKLASDDTAEIRAALFRVSFFVVAKFGTLKFASFRRVCACSSIFTRRPPNSSVCCAKYSSTASTTHRSAFAATSSS